MVIESFVLLLRHDLKPNNKLLYITKKPTQPKHKTLNYLCASASLREIKMTPTQLKTYLKQLIDQNIKISTMIWGAPGIGKSSIVSQLAQEHDIDFVDVRLSQLAPTDLRGLPVAEDGISKWYPPEFLPSQGKGILFMDELNMAPPALQGVAQQLILDRRVGSYVVPEDWYVWAAGNRKEDRAAVFDMPAPLANRFLHLQVEADFDSFKAHALEKQVHEQILAFLSFRSTLLHKHDLQQPALVFASFVGDGKSTTLCWFRHCFSSGYGCSSRIRSIHHFI